MAESDSSALLVDLCASPSKKQRLPDGAVSATAWHIPPLLAVGQHGEEASLLLTESSTVGGLLSPHSTAELEALTYTFSMACRCHASASPPPSQLGHCHLDVRKIEGQLQTGFLASGTATATTAASRSFLPEAHLVTRMSSAPCSCIRLPSPPPAAAVGGTIIGSLKRRHASPPPPTPARTVADTTAALAAASMREPSMAHHAGAAMATSSTRSVFRPRHSHLASLPPASIGTAATAAALPCSSLAAEYPEGLISPGGSVDSCCIDQDDDDDTAAGHSPSDVGYDGRRLHATTTMVASTASTRPLSPISTDAYGESTRADDGMVVDREEYARLQSTLDEIRQIEDEENEAEINYLLEKMHSQQTEQTFMPYIS